MFFLVRVYWCWLGHGRKWVAFDRADGEKVFLCAPCRLEFPR